MEQALNLVYVSPYHQLVLVKKDRGKEQTFFRQDCLGEESLGSFVIDKYHGTRDSCGE